MRATVPASTSQKHRLITNTRLLHLHTTDNQNLNYIYTTLILSYLTRKEPDFYLKPFSAIALSIAEATISFSDPWLVLIFFALVGGQSSSASGPKAGDTRSP